MTDVVLLCLVALLVALVCLERSERRRLGREVALLRRAVYRLRWVPSMPSVSTTPGEPSEQILDGAHAELASLGVVDRPRDTAPPPPSFTAIIDDERTEAETEIWSPPTRRERGRSS